MLMKTNIAKNVHVKIMIYIIFMKFNYEMCDKN